MLSVPYASAPTACAPPTAYTSSMPNKLAAAAIVGCTSPISTGGETTQSWSTPATCAGTAVISRLENSGTSPAGTHSPTRSMGVIFLPNITPSPSSTNHELSFCRSWKARMLATAASIETRKFGSSAVSASASTDAGTRNCPGHTSTPSKRCVSAHSAASPSFRTCRRMSRTASSTSGSDSGRRANRAASGSASGSAG